LTGAGLLTRAGEAQSRSRYALRPPPYTLFIWMVTLASLRRDVGKMRESSFAAFSDKNRIFWKVKIFHAYYATGNGHELLSVA
jgi:hypothetical protein